MHCPAWDLQVLGPESVESEGGNNDACEARQRRVGDLSTDRHDEQNPRLRVLCCLDSLMFAEVPILDSLPIRRHSVDSDETFLLRQELRRRRKIREHDEGYHSPGDGDGAEDQEDVHPLRQTRGNVSYRIANKSTEHGRDAVCAVVDFETEGLLGGGIPH